MIEVYIRDDGITVTGHSGYAPPGQDIICAAVSALVETLVSSVEEYTSDTMKADIQPGKAVIQYENLSERSKLLVDSFFIGISSVAESYPDQVRLL